MLLAIDDLHAGYGELDVLRGVSIAVDAGEIVAVLGANGAGKSTLLRTISRYETRVRSGSIVFDGHDLIRASVESVVRLGCSQVPEGRQLFTELTVDDNLRLGAFARDRRTLEADITAMYDRFPSLAARRAATAFSLSGGEQQMLAIGRALMTSPRLLILDEATEGLAPLIRDEIWRVIATIRETGIATIVVDKTVAAILSVVDRSTILVKGTIVYDGSPQALRANTKLMHRCLGV